MKKAFLLLAVLTWWVSACSSAVPEATLTASPVPPASQTASPSGTPLPPAATATPAPIEGTTRVQINVRSGPAVSFATLGMIAPNQKVQIFAKSSDGKWYAILFPGSPLGRGWVAADFIQVPNAADIPPAAPDSTATPSGPTGQVMQKLNVRSGPGTTYDSLGMLLPQSVVVLTGKNATATWLQIEYSAAPGGHGWVTSAYIQADKLAALPVLDASGKPVPPNAGTGIPAQEVTFTPTVGIALEDGDSAANPAARVTFSPAGPGQFSYSGQASAPQGDAEDWIEFTPNSLAGSSARLTASLACTGNGTLAVELLQNGLPLSTWGTLACGDTQQVLLLHADMTYQFHLRAVAGEGLSLVTYTLTIRNEP